MRMQYVQLLVCHQCFREGPGERHAMVSHATVQIAINHGVAEKYGEGILGADTPLRKLHFLSNAWGDWDNPGIVGKLCSFLIFVLGCHLTIMKSANMNQMRGNG